MSISLALATYFICWWLALFMVLPFGVRTQEEEGSIIPGSVESAPSNPHIWTKLGITTLVGFVLFGLVYLVVATDFINIDKIPFLPNI
ncbi:MAG: hypothetical protein DHS20C08_05000 [Rhodomicrobium sp.]|nr:MAG: hypothetical protein DHS20C08_05000 [Rhodomicrobium sp.]